VKRHPLTTLFVKIITRVAFFVAVAGFAFGQRNAITLTLPFPDVAPNRNPSVVITDRGWIIDAFSHLGMSFTQNGPISIQPIERLSEPNCNLYWAFGSSAPGGFTAEKYTAELPGLTIGNSYTKVVGVTHSLVLAVASLLLAVQLISQRRRPVSKQMQQNAA
jgi:hypothetical protein